MLVHENITIFLFVKVIVRAQILFLIIVNTLDPRYNAGPYLGPRYNEGRVITRWAIGLSDKMGSKDLPPL